MNDDNEKRLSVLAFTINQIRQISLLSTELLDILTATGQWLLHYTERNGIPFSDAEHLRSLLQKSSNLLKQMGQSTAVLERYLPLTDDMLGSRSPPTKSEQPDETTEDGAEPK